MQTYKSKRRLRKIKKFGKRVGIAIFFLGISYLLSLLSFYYFFIPNFHRFYSR